MGLEKADEAEGKEEESSKIKDRKEHLTYLRD